MGTVRLLWFSLEIEHGPKKESSRNRAKRGIDTMDELEDNQFADDVPRDPKSVTLINEMCVEPNFRNFSSGSLVLDFGSLHQKPLIL